MRQAGALQGILLIMCAWCTVLASGALAPVLPQIRDTFLDTANLDLMIGFVATAPSLAVALFAIPLGRLADRIGLTQVLLCGLAAYGVAGVIPFWLHDLDAIIGTRFVVGIAEGAIMTTSTALIGYVFSGSTRARWLGIQVAAANFLGILVLYSGGLLGLAGWHTPFLIYSFALFLLVPCLFALPRPAPTGRPAGEKPRMLWPAGLKRLVGESCGLIFVSTIGLFTIIVQLAFLLEERGAADSSQIGLALALSALGIALGATTGGLLGRIETLAKLRIAFLLIGSGYLAMMLVGSAVATIATGAVAGFGCGMVIPVLLSRLLGGTPPQLMGGVTGIWIAATFIGQFCNPPLYIMLREIAGSQSGATGIFGAFCLLLALSIPWLVRKKPHQPIAQS